MLYNKKRAINVW